MTKGLSMRRGIIKITDIALMQAKDSVLFGIFSKFIPVRSEFDYMSGTFILKGYSKAFDTVKEHEEPPEYQVVVNGQIVTF